MPDSVSDKINAIRQKAGNPMTQCPTCCRPAESPFRAFDPRGEVIMGCIDAFHTGHLVRPSASSDWHNRKHAVILRRNELNHLKSLRAA